MVSDNDESTKRGWLPATADWVYRNWEKSLFRFFGIALFVFAFLALRNSNVTEFVSVSAAGIFCFIYANFTKFRKFKGLGFEAELWEDKQAEAAKLIDQLKEIVAIYSRETLMSRVRHARLYSANDEKHRWKEIWSLYETLTGEHSRIGQQIDFRALKKELETYFIFDAMLPTYRNVHSIILDGRKQAGKKISEEFGSPIKDSAGYGARLEQLRAIQFNLGEPIELAQKRELSKQLISWFDHEQKSLKAHFGVDIHLDDDTKELLEYFTQMEARQTLDINQGLIEKFANLASQKS
jgi:hypothetical protein